MNDVLIVRDIYSRIASIRVTKGGIDLEMVADFAAKALEASSMRATMLIIGAQRALLAGYDARFKCSVCSRGS